MIQNPPILRALDSVRAVDPTKVRHQGRGWSIAGKSEETFDLWSDHLVDRSFLPITAESNSVVSQMGATNSAGPDVMENVLLIVR